MTICMTILMCFRLITIKSQNTQSCCSCALWRGPACFFHFWVPTVKSQQTLPFVPPLTHLELGSRDFNLFLCYFQARPCKILLPLPLLFHGTARAVQRAERNLLLCYWSRNTTISHLQLKDSTPADSPSQESREAGTFRSTLTKG